MPNQTGSPQDYWASIRKRERKNGNFAYTVLCHLNGRQFPVTFDSEIHAEAFKTAVKAHGIHRALKMHDLEPPRRNEAGAEQTTVAQWLRHHIDHLTGVEQYTLDVYERYLKLDIAPTLGDIPLKALAEEDISRWVKNMEVTKSKKTGRVPKPKTIANRHGFLSGALGAAVTKGLIPANPAAGRWLPRTTGDPSETDDEDDDMRMLSRAEFDALLDACAEYYRPLLRLSGNGTKAENDGGQAATSDRTHRNRADGPGTPRASRAGAASLPTQQSLGPARIGIQLQIGLRSPY
jgi:integrase